VENEYAKGAMLAKGGFRLNVEHQATEEAPVRLDE